MIEELSYSFHVGNDKNKTSKAKQIAKERPTNFNNNAIQNGIQLSKVNHHNLRVYENNPELITTIKGTNDIVKDTKKLYLDLFEESRINYNNKQTRDDRKIDNYFNKIANDNKHDLAVEIIIELGNMYYWSDKTMEEKYKMVGVFEKQVFDLEKLIPSFKVANATIHFDESSPHLHIVGVPFKENCKTGMNRQVGKSDVFNVESLKDIQKELRESCIKEFNKVYNLDMELKEKEQGRNQDYRVSQMNNYDKLKDSYKKQHKKITEINKNVDKINVKSNEVKEILENLKQQPLSKNNLIISSDKKDKLLEYIKDIDTNNKNFKSISNYNLSLENIKKDLDDNYKTIRTLTNDNENLNIKLEEKETLLIVAKNTIDNLNKKVIELESKVESWKQRFNKIVDFISERVKGFFGNILKNKYKDVADDLRENNIITEKEYKKIYDLPIRKEYKEDKKINDDFEL